MDDTQIKQAGLSLFDMHHESSAFQEIYKDIDLDEDFKKDMVKQIRELAASWFMLGYKVASDEDVDVGETLH